MSRCVIATTVAVGLATLLAVSGLPATKAWSFGFATFSAVVNPNGNTARGAGVQSSSRTSEGRYVVRFTRNVKKCAFVASVKGKNGGQASVTPVPNKGRRLRVDTFSKNGQRTDLSFVLLVSCI